MSDYRVLYLGTPDFAVPALRALAERGYQLRVITQPDRPTGRKRLLTPPSVKQEALRLGLPVLQPERLKTPEVREYVASFSPDVMVTAAYGKILPEWFLEMAKQGGLNIHASLLPRWRGAAPIQRAIMAGDTVTGVTLIQMVRELDAGPILAAAQTEIAANDNVETLHQRLAEMGAQLLIQYLPDYLAGCCKLQPQPAEGVTYAERILRDDEWIDFCQPACQVDCQIRALTPWPGASVMVESEPMKLWNARLLETVIPAKAVPGEVVMNGNLVSVACGDGRWIELIEVQPSGRRRMPADAWMRGLNGRQVIFSCKDGHP